MRLSARIKCFRYLVYAYIVLISVSWSWSFKSVGNVDCLSSRKWPLVKKEVACRSARVQWKVCPRLEVCMRDSQFVCNVDVTIGKRINRE